MSLRRTGVPWVVALAALSYLVLMYFSGSAPTHKNRIENTDNGVMAQTPEEISRVSITRGAVVRRFRRESGTWRASDPTDPLAAETLDKLKLAIRFMHTAPPVRILLPEETAGITAADYGFDPPLLTVQLGTADGEILKATFGDRSNDGILRYLKISGRGETYLMSGFIGDAWETLSKPQR